MATLKMPFKQSVPLTEPYVADGAAEGGLIEQSAGPDAGASHLGIKSVNRPPNKPDASADFLNPGKSEWSPD